MSELSRWMLSQIGRESRFRSARQWSLAAGLNQSAVNTIIERGQADPVSLIKIGKAAGKTEHEMFELAGWLPPLEETKSLPPGEQEALALYRQLSPGDQDLLSHLLRRLVRPGS